MSNVYLEVIDSTLIIRATDAKVGFETRIPVSETEPGAITVFCDKLSAIMSAIPQGDITFELHDSTVEIRPISRKIRFQLKTISGDKFPVIPDIRDKTFFGLKAADLLEMISQTIFQCSNDETRFFMNGIFMENCLRIPSQWSRPMVAD